MNKHYRFALVISFILALAVVVGCSARQTKSIPEKFEPTCIGGTVWYRTVADPSPVRYPHAKITAWLHDTDQALGEIQADEAGNYCIEVPLGHSGIDLRVWGLKDLGGTSYTCKGSVDNIQLGTGSRRCGAECMKVDIMTDCNEFFPRRRRWSY